MRFVLKCVRLIFFHVFSPFRKIMKSVISFAMSVCPSNNVAPTMGIFMKFDKSIFSKTCSENSNFITI